MGIDSIIKHVIKEGLITEKNLLSRLLDLVNNITLRDYNNLVSLCKRNHIDATSFFSSIYMKAKEDVQYQMWKDGYVESCPAGKLIADIVSESSDTLKIIDNDYNKKIIRCEAYFEDIQDIIINHISHAKKSLKIAMAWFTNPVIFNYLLKACKRGVRVELLINNDKINNKLNGLPFDKLIQNEAALYVAEPPSLIHHKFCIIDDRTVIDGSYNWTIGAETNNDENIVVIENGKVIDTFIKTFKKLLREYKKVDYMPAYVPERQEYDCTSYRYINSEEYLIQLPTIKNKRLQREIYKEIYKLLPEESASEKIPSDIYESIKSEVEEEQNKDNNLFNTSLVQKSEELKKESSKKEREIRSKTRRRDDLIQKKEAIKNRHKSTIKSINTRQIPQSEKDKQIRIIKSKHRAELRRINHNISKINAEISSLSDDSELLSTQQCFINSIQAKELQGGNGLCRINLRWDTSDDIDLHLILPNGTIDSSNDVYYGHKRVEFNGGICFLDHDAIPNEKGENPQENIVWKEKLPDGKYMVKVKLYNKKSGNSIIPFFVSVFTGKYVKTDVYYFHNAYSGQVIDIASLTFKKGKVVTPIIFNKNNY